MTSPPSTWLPLGQVPPSDLIDARIQLHFAAQHVAAVGASLAEARPDASHKAFTYDPATHAVVGTLVDGARPFRAALVLPTITLRLVDVGGAAIDELPLTGRTDDDAVAWLTHHAEMLMGAGQEVVPHRYDDDFPAHAVGEGAVYTVEPNDPRLVELDAYFTDTQSLLEDIRAMDDGSPIRIWPHHFDLATLLDAGVAADGTARTIGVGLSPGDGLIAEPYWYVAPWPGPLPEQLPVSAPPVVWRAEPWFGAVLTASSMLASGADPRFVVTAFAAAAVETSHGLLVDSTH